MRLIPSSTIQLYQREDIPHLSVMQVSPSLAVRVLTTSLSMVYRTGMQQIFSENVEGTKKVYPESAVVRRRYRKYRYYRLR